MKTTTATSATTAAMAPARMESCAEARADGALLDDGQVGRQRAGAQQHREVLRALDGEIALDLAGAAEDRRADHRRGDVLVVEHDGEAAADIRLRHLAEDRARRAC